jgi:RimJ/RimL family protein N-acetyltransferase
VTVTLRRAEPGDVDFLLELDAHDDVHPFLSARRPRDRDEILAQVERSLREPEEHGRLVVEVDGARAGALSFSAANRRSRIAWLGGLALLPEFRGRGVADQAARLLQRLLLLELGYHRLELECYDFNEAAIRHAERVGFRREGVKRRAYWRHGRWNDAVCFALLREDLQGRPR